MPIEDIAQSNMDINNVYETTDVTSVSRLLKNEYAVDTLTA